MRSAQFALIRKDIKEIFSNKDVYLPLIIVSFVFLLLLPVGIFVLMSIDPVMLEREVGEILVIIEPYFPVAGLSAKEAMILFAIEMMLPSLFLIEPIMVSSIIAGSSIIGEKEKKTIETLLYSPLTTKTLFIAKVGSSFLFSMMVMAVCTVLLTIVLNAGGLLTVGRFIFPSIRWLIIIFVLSPALVLLGITFMVYLSAKAKSYQEAQQKAVFIILPILALMISQVSGLIFLQWWMLLLISLIVLGIALLLASFASKRFIPESLIL